MPCQSCAHWNLRNQPTMGKLGFGTCNLQPSRWVYYPPQHTCEMHKQATDEIVSIRETYLEKIK